jgi:hypothetical protein
LNGAAFAFAMIWAVNPMLKNPTGFLSVYALLVGLFCALFTSFGNKFALVALLFAFLPVLLSALVHRPLVLFSKKTARTTGA